MDSTSLLMQLKNINLEINHLTFNDNFYRQKKRLVNYIEIIS